MHLKIKQFLYIFMLMNPIKRWFSQQASQVRMGKRVGLPTPVMSTEDLHKLVHHKLSQLPFFVARTDFGKGLPVYSDLKAGRTQQLTVIRRVYGDAMVLAKWLQVEMPRKVVRVRVKPEQQKIVIKGNVVEDVKLFLTDLGF